MEQKDKSTIFYICGCCGMEIPTLRLYGATKGGALWGCPGCGPIDSELMATCREITLGTYLN